MKYKPVNCIVEAFRWSEDLDQAKYPKWAVEAIERGKGDGWPKLFIKANPFLIMIIENKPYTQSLMHPGDYLVKGVNGELFAVKADDFHKEYEAIALP